jgi:hypothetical protein
MTPRLVLYHCSCPNGRGVSTLYQCPFPKDVDAYIDAEAPVNSQWRTLRQTKAQDLYNNIIIKKSKRLLLETILTTVEQNITCLPDILN